MAIKLRRGTDTQRLSVVLEEGEIAYTTDTKKLYIGDGVTAGGNEIGGTTAAELLKVEVHNATGSTVAAGAVVYLNGNTGNKPNLNLAKADAEATSSKTIGLVTASISNNANGEIATDGLLEGLDTSIFVAGDMLWLSDSVAGGVTTIIPDTPNHAVFIGYVKYAHPSNGAILIHIQNGYELNELHDVKITSVADGDGLIYDSTLGYWKNSNTVTLQGNTFNAANKLVQLDGTAKLPAVDGSQLTNLPSFSPPNGLLKIVSAISTTLQTVTDYLGNLSVLQLNSRRVGILSDSSVTTQTSSVIQATTTNANLVISPNGTGAIIANIPDGTATGGNARGTNAVDLQTSININTQVASGQYSNISGGRGNTASNTYSVVGGGNANNNSSLGGTIAGGRSNTNSASADATIGGGNSNSVSSNYSVISGGQSNAASNDTHNTVVGGQSNTASGKFSVVGGQGSVASSYASTSFGSGCNATGGRAFVAGGDGNTASGNFSIVLSGQSNQATSTYSVASGQYAITYLAQQRTIANRFDALGNPSDSQISDLIACRLATLNTGGTTVLSLDGTGVSNLIIPRGNNRAWNVQVNWVAVVTAISGTATGISVGDVVTSVDLLGFKRVGGTSSASAHTSAATKLMVTSPAQYAGCSIAYTAGASQEMAMAFTGPTFAGGGSVTMRIVARVELSEVAW